MVAAGEKDGGDDDVAVYDWPELKVGDCHMA